MKLTSPVSSETTTANASVSSVTPMAARWRVPSSRRELRVDRDREEAGRRGGAVALDDDGAVVERRLRVEDREQEVVGDDRVEPDAALDVVPKPDVPLEDEDRADAAAEARVSAANTISSIVPLLVFGVQEAEQGCRAEVREPSPQLLLIEHDDREADIGERVSQEPVHRGEIGPSRGEEQQDEQERPHHHLQRALRRE